MWTEGDIFNEAQQEKVKENMSGEGGCLGHVERTIEVSEQTAADVLAEVRENWVLLARIFGGHSSFKRDGNPFGRLLAKTNSLTSDRAILRLSRRFMVKHLHV